MKDKDLAMFLKYIGLVVTVLYTPFVLISIFALQGVGSINFETGYAIAVLIVFNPINTLAILAAYIFRGMRGIVYLSSLLLAALFAVQSLLILFGFSGGDWFLPLILAIPSILYISYYRTVRKKLPT